MDGSRTHGGYSEKVVVAEHFVLKVPDALDLAGAAPLLCAGITLYSPLRHWGVKPGSRVAIIGLGKMGLSHFSIINAHRDVKVVGVCDSSSYVLDILSKYTGVGTYSDMGMMLDAADVQAAVISTPSKYHAPMVRDCLERGIHVFCEKPFCLDPADSTGLAQLAREKGLKTVVGAWIGPDRARNEREIESLIALAREGLVGVAVVGNEVLLRGFEVPESRLGRAFVYAIAPFEL